MSVNTETSSLKKEISNANANGLSIGQSATDLIGFYGITTPIAQRSGASQATIAKSVTTVAKTATTPAAITSTTPTKTATTVGTTPATSTTPFGYASAVQADSVPTQINAINVDIIDLRAQQIAANVDIAAIRAQVAAASVDLDNFRTQLLNTNTDMTAVVALSNEMRNSLVALNMIKGSS